MTSKAFGLAQLGNAYADGALSNRNKIINGAMTIDQRNAGAATANTISGYTLDRWAVFQTVTGKLIAQQNAGSVTPPVGFTNYLGVTSQSAYSVGASDYYLIDHRIEGFNTADLAWGTADAKPVTISFWVRSSLTGTFGASLRNASANRSYPFTYTINAVNTWEYKTISIAGDTSGTWGAGNGIGIELLIGLGVGSTLSGSAGAWAGANYLGATGATSVVATSGATFYLTGVQLEAGDTATPFEHRSYGQELALCQRYYWQDVGQNVAQFDNYNVSGASCIAPISFPVQMRAAPTGAIIGAFIGSNTQTPSMNVRTSLKAQIQADATSSTRCQMYCNAGNGYSFSAEL